LRRHLQSPPAAVTADPAAGAPGPPGAGPADRLARLREHVRTPLFGNAYALTLNIAVTTTLGSGYWVLAARLYSPRELGVGAAAVSTMTFLSNLSQLNLNAALSRFLPESGLSGGRLVAYAYGASSLVAILISSVFLAVASRVSDHLAFLTESPLLAVLFCLSVAAWGIFTLQDSVLVALRGAVWVPVENATFGVAKVLLLVALAGTVPTLGVFVSWNAPVVVALVPVNLLVFRILLPRLRSFGAARLPDWRVLRRFVALDYLGYLFMQAGTNALPLLVTAQLGAAANGRFYVAYAIGNALELVAYNFGVSLTVEGSRDQSRLALYTQQILRRGFLLFTPTVMLGCLAAPLLLTVFGRGYAQSSSALLRLLLLAVLPKLLVAIFVAASRVQKRIGRIVIVQALTSTLVLSLSLVSVGRLGILGVGLAYLISQTVVAVTVLPSLARLLRTVRP
jgi:O-antigen/teichoic acid export membrane protein